MSLEFWFLSISLEFWFLSMSLEFWFLSKSLEFWFLSKSLEFWFLSKSLEFCPTWLLRSRAPTLLCTDDLSFTPLLEVSVSRYFRWSRTFRLFFLGNIRLFSPSKAIITTVMLSKVFRWIESFIMFSTHWALNSWMSLNPLWSCSQTHWATSRELHLSKMPSPDERFINN